MSLNLHKIAAIIFYRKSSKSYINDKAIPNEDILSFFEAARWAPSAKNIQPWHYILFTESDPEQIELMRSCLVPMNQTWANHAPVLILSCAQLTKADGSSNPYALHDLGLANENLLLQIRSLGYNCRPMGGFDKEKTAALFNLPENIQPVIVIAAGFAPKFKTLSDQMKIEVKSPRIRKEINEWLYQGKWGNKIDPNSFY
ncbi:MAG: nitroreductase family protein [Anaerolineaceae bacterium]|nr:nitroreductase family protein [Anaerolineaceae bacterium]